MAAPLPEDFRAFMRDMERVGDQLPPARPPKPKHPPHLQPVEPWKPPPATPSSPAPSGKTPKPPATKSKRDKLVWFDPDPPPEDPVHSGRTRDEVLQLVRELGATRRYLEAGIDPSTRVLFSGPSGTGKTLTARWIGARLRLPVAIVDVGKAVTPLIGSTAGNMAGFFEEALAEPSILFLDEIDAVAPPRGLGAHGTRDGADVELERATTTLFQQLDWLSRERIVMAATNFGGKLDPALERRFTTQLAFELPDAGARRLMLQRWLAGARPTATELEQLVAVTEGLGGAEVRSAGMRWARRMLLEERSLLP